MTPLEALAVLITGYAATIALYLAAMGAAWCVEQVVRWGMGRE